VWIGFAVIGLSLVLKAAKSVLTMQLVLLALLALWLAA
jgi:hypothetical protein